MALQVTGDTIKLNGGSDTLITVASQELTLAPTTLSVNTDTATFASANAADPLLVIKNTTNDTDGPRLRFVKDKGAAGADGDVAGIIEFYADDDNQDQVLFAHIKATVADASNSAEGGKLELGVASHDGEMNAGITIADGDAEDEIDITIGKGGSSMTTVSGDITVTGDLTVSGTTTTVSSTVTTIADPLIELNTGAGSNANDLGFVFERGSTGDNACLIWDESADVFAVGTTTATGTSTGDMTFTAVGFAAGAIAGTTVAASSTVTATGGFVGTLNTAAQGNITSLGTLTALTVDDVAIDGKVITMTGDSSDTVTMTAAAAALFTIATTDDAGTDGHIVLDADGDVKLDAATGITRFMLAGDTDDLCTLTVAANGATTLATADSDGTAGHLTLDVAGNITLDADAGTITFADGGSSLGTITSSGWTGDVVGDVTGDVTGNADTATEATNITCSANNSADETVYPVFVDGATGTQGAETDTGLTYNPSSGLLTATLLAGTLNTAAQGNITSLGTLTALTVDDVAMNGKVITMTGSTDDTATFTAGTNGTLDITTTDAAGAAANITITADGTFEAVGTTITLDSGGAINLEPATGSAILLDGTISIDAGVVTGATSITSDAFVGALTGNATTATSMVVADTNETSCFVALWEAATGAESAKSDAGLTYNASTGALNATIFVTDSDLRLKENVRTIENAVDVVSALRGVRYDWKKNSMPDVGFIAQEISEVLPELVHEDPTSGYLGVEYGKITGLLVEAIKEQQEEIKSLRAQQGQIDELKAMVAALMNKA